MAPGYAWILPAIGAGQGWQTGGGLPYLMVIPTLIPARLLCYLMSWAENAKRGCRFQLPSLDDGIPGSHSGPPPGMMVRSETVDLQ